MIVEFSVYDTEAYSVEHLLDSKENIEPFPTAQKAERKSIK